MPAQTPNPPLVRLLIDPPSATADDASAPLPPALSRLLGRAGRREACVDGAHAGISRCLGWRSPADAPWARAWRARSAAARDPLETRRWWLLEPVTLVAGMNSVALQPLAAPLDAEATDLLAHEFAAVFDGSPWTLATAAGRLMLHADPECAVHSAPAFACIARDLRDLLPSGAGAGLLRRLMTECQMRLHALAESGALPLRNVTGVWPWGEGGTERANPTGTCRIVSHDPLIMALVAWAAHRDMPHASDSTTRTGAGWPADFDQASARLLLRPAGQSAGTDIVWHGPRDHAALPDLIGQACGALWRRRIARLECTLLPAPAAAGLTATLSWSDLLRFWRRAPSP